MAAVLLALLAAQPAPGEPSRGALERHFMEQTSAASELMDTDPDLALRVLNELLDDPRAKRLEGSSPILRSYREEALMLRAHLRLNRGEAAAVADEMTAMVEARRGQLSARIASLAGSLASPLPGTPVRVALSLPRGATLSRLDWSLPLAVRADAWRKLGETDREQADRLMSQEIISELMRGLPTPQPYQPPPPSRWSWVMVQLGRLLQAVYQPQFVAGVFVVMIPVFFVLGLRQRRDAGGSWLRLLWVSLALAALQTAPVLTAFLLLGSSLDLLDASLISCALTVFVFNMIWLSSYQKAVTWERSREAPPLLEDAAVLARVREIAAGLGIAPPVTRLVHSASSQQLNQALVTGLSAPTVVLFDGILHRLSAEERDVIIAHELAHLANHSFWLYLAVSAVCSVTTVAAAAFFPPVVAFGLGASLLVGARLITSRWLELDCDRRAAGVIGHRRAASALWKIHADQPFRHQPVFEFLIGAASTHPSRDERLAAIAAAAPAAAAPADDRPDVDWDPKLLSRRRLAARLAVGLWLAVLLSCLTWAYYCPDSGLPAAPLFLTAAAPTALLLLGLRKAARRRSQLIRVPIPWLADLVQLAPLLLLALVAAEYFELTERYVGGWARFPILVVALVVCLGLPALTRRLSRTQSLTRRLAVAIQSGDYPKALALCEASPAVAAGSTALRHDRALILAVLGRRDEAIRELEQLRSDAPAFKLTWMTLASLYADEGRHAEALGLAAELSRDLPEEPAGPQAEAWLLRKLGRGDEAEARARRALEMEPGGATAILALAGVALDRGDLASARERLAEAERLAPGDVGGVLIAAEIALAAGDPGAEEAVRRAGVAAVNNPLAFAQKEAAALARRLEAARGAAVHQEESR